MDIITELTDFDYKKRSYLKSCLKMGTEYGCSTARKNSQDTLDYINELEVSVMKLNAQLLEQK